MQATTIKTVDELKQDYKIKEIIGKGAYASVRLAVHRETKMNVAIKIMNKKRMEEEDLVGLENEVQFLSEIDHPNVVQLLDLHEDKDNFCLVLERVQGGELYDHLAKTRGLVESEIHRLMIPVFDAVFYCHGMGIIHRDLKPDNLLVSLKDLDQAVIKISDFGLARKVNPHDLATTVCGTPTHVAPEIINE
jgi:serine/threonine protein kinase